MMSKFTDYDRTSEHYDVGRRPAAVDLVLAMMQHYTGRSLADLHVLDAGCGTGNYARALLDAGVGKITMIDASAGMLEKARSKVKDAVTNGQVHVIKQVLLPDIPFGDNSFDVVMFNLVLHHLDDDTDGHPQIAACIQEAGRVLKSGGLLVIGTTSPDQVREGFWYAKLNSSITARVAAKYPDSATFKHMLQVSRFRSPDIYNVMGSDWFINYDDAEGPLKPAWRTNDSFWSAATEKELEEVITLVKNMKMAGTLQRFKEESDGADVIGHFSIILSTVRE